MMENMNGNAGEIAYSKKEARSQMAACGCANGSALRKGDKLAYSTREAAETIGTVPGVMANWRCAKVGPKYYRHNRKIFYLREDLIAWLKMNPIMTKDTHDIEYR